MLRDGRGESQGLWAEPGSLLFGWRGYLHHGGGHGAVVSAKNGVISCGTPPRCDGIGLRGCSSGDVVVSDVIGSKITKGGSSADNCSRMRSRRKRRVFDLLRWEDVHRARGSQADGSASKFATQRSGHRYLFGSGCCDLRLGDFSVVGTTHLRGESGRAKIKRSREGTCSSGRRKVKTGSSFAGLSLSLSLLLLLLLELSLSEHLSLLCLDVLS